MYKLYPHSLFFLHLTPRSTSHYTPPMTDPVKLVPTAPDAEVAAQIREAVTKQLLALCPVIDDARSKGFVVQFQLGLDYANRQVIQNLVIAKHY